MSDFLERNGQRDMTALFKNLFLASVHRNGAEELLERLENETDFFEAPAGAKHHGAFPGGLVIHSLNVYYRLREITIRDLTKEGAPGPATLSEQEEETVAILGLLHDVCKAGVYHAETKRRRNPETGVWEDYLGYTFRDPLPLGHGEKSLYQITRFIRLEDYEALAIRWHMGAYDTAARTDLRDLSAAMDATPWVWRLHEADMCAAHIDERGTDGRMTKLLCKPCAVDLAARGKTVKPVAQRCEKITCSECGRRRFGITYEVTGRATRKKEATKK